MVHGILKNTYLNKKYEFLICANGEIEETKKEKILEGKYDISPPGQLLSRSSGLPDEPFLGGTFASV
jgi:hypothetical protein